MFVWKKLAKFKEIELNILEYMSKKILTLCETWKALRKREHGPANRTDVNTGDLRLDLDVLHVPQKPP